MFLRWLRYRDKAGRVRLYARLLSSHRQGGKVRQRRSDYSLRVCIQQGVAWSEEQRRDFWSHLDHVLGNRPTPRERANIERTFAAELGPRPPMSAFEEAMHAVFSRYPATPP